MLKSLVKVKQVLFQVSSDLGEVNSFDSSFPDVGQKDPLCLSKVQKRLSGIGLKRRFYFFERQMCKRVTSVLEEKKLN